MKIAHHDNKTQLLITERGTTHGDFYEHAYISQEMKKVLRQGVRWDDLTCVQKEALQMIVHKIGRILSGDPDFADHWEDLSGYSQLVLDTIRKATVS